MSNYSITRVYFKKRREAVEAFDVIFGSEKPEEFDECCGEKCQCCRKGTLLPRVFLAVISTLTLVGQFIYARLYGQKIDLPGIALLPTLVGLPIIAFIISYWVEAFLCCWGHSTVKVSDSSCCACDINNHWRCVYISFTAVVWLFFGCLSFNIVGFMFTAEGFMSHAIQGYTVIALSFAILLIGVLCITLFIIYRIDCDASGDKPVN
jgi:hypothetical protein